ADIRLLRHADVEIAAPRAHPVEFFVAVAPVVRKLLVDVAAGGKRAAGAGQDDAADRIVGVEALHRVVQLADQPPVHRIEFVGPVQGDDADAVFRFDQDVLLIHLLSPIYAEAGRVLRNGVAFSKASATRSRVASWNGFAAICTATGRPPSPNPAQTEIAG